MPLADFQNLIDDFVRDDVSKITTTDRDEAMQLAVSRYSKDRPQTKVEDLVSPGGQLLDLPPAWETNFSKLNLLETPIGNVPPTLIADDHISLYQTPTGEVFQLAYSLATSAAVRANYTIKHVLDVSNDTIPLVDREAVSAWAAAALCDQLASHYSGDSDSTIQADTVDHGDKASKFALRAKDLRKRYYNELGIDPKRNVAAGVVVNMDLTNSQGNDRLTHPNRRR